MTATVHGAGAQLVAAPLLCFGLQILDLLQWNAVRLPKWSNRLASLAISRKVEKLQNGLREANLFNYPIASIMSP
ncbi:MAG: hypothetical protein WCP31_01515 [Chloroflexales bacterium]